MRSTRPFLLGLVAVAVLATLGGFAWYLSSSRNQTLADADPAAYEELVRAFYRGLASLETGLLDTAKTSFGNATEIAPNEPAAWANLGVARLRGAEFDAAGDAIARAVALAPRSSEVAVLEGALEGARGRLEAAAASLQRAVDLDPGNGRARFAFADILERSGGADGDSLAQQQLEQLLALDADNLAVVVERTRLAAKRRDGPLLADSLRRINAIASSGAGWPEAAGAQITDLTAAVDRGAFPAAQRSIAFLRNVLLRVPRFRDDLARVRIPAELVAASFDRFLTLPSPSSTPSPPDTALTYTVDTLGDDLATRVLAWPVDTSGTFVLFASDARSVRRLDGPGTWPASGDTVLLPFDWNHDFRTDLLVGGEAGVRLLVQDDRGGFADATDASGLTVPPARRAVSGAWTADLDMDGDLDLVVGSRDGGPLVLRNNGDGTARALPLFGGVSGLRAFTWGDIDGDGDPDAALLGADGAVRVFANQQAGVFDPLETISGSARAMALGDMDGDGRLDLVTLDAAGVVRRASLVDAQWQIREIASWNGLPSEQGDYRVLLEDLDNNGGLDLIVAASGASRAWLSDATGTLQPLNLPPAVEVFGAADLNEDGRLDLVGLSERRPVRLLARGTLPYHWQTLRLRAQTSAGDQRINAFGVGGEVEVRSGLLVQKQGLTGAPVHVGLGTRGEVDVARIVWPNGVMQAEFDLQGDQTIVAEQRLKGSCPWVFADDGTGVRFVTDFLWRSPLGLRINAQDTAGITQTEDWVKIRGDQLAPRDGKYDVRITAELWETHFFDHVSLMVVDHPRDAEVFVDERFTRTAPVLAVQAMTPPTPVAGAWDDRGRDVTGEVTRRDGRHAAGFERGPYQGLTPPHAIEVDLGPEAPGTGPLLLVAQGWVYPTDSSINVAIAQGGRPAPHGLALDAMDTRGVWHTLNADLGFPAGKNKTILLDLSGRPSGSRRFRLRTTMEIYWDALSWAVPSPDAAMRVVRLPAMAELRFRGFSQTVEDRDAHAPETPLYDALANTAPRWRDLVGYHTRFGDVSELLTRVDDRYVIMNAGDELRLSFDAPAAPPDGWQRDFVLIGDGWEKDGDFNTGYSQTVLPLPRHGHPEYTAQSLELERDPVYRQHPDDWQRFHTRFVSPDRYLRGLWPVAVGSGVDARAETRP